MGFSLAFWRKKEAAPAQAASTPEAHHRLNRMAEALAELTKKTYEQQNEQERHATPVEHHHTAEHAAAQHHVTSEHHAQLLFPKHEEHLLIPDHHAEKQYIPETTSSPMTSIDFAARATNAFYAQNGAVFWTLGELGDALLSLSDETFAHHVNAERNDFASWIAGCFSGAEQAFAESVRSESREGMLKAFIDAKRPALQEHTMRHTAPQPVIEYVREPVKIQEESQHHDEKQPTVTTWVPVKTEPEFSVARVLEDLSAARLMAKVDITAAREKFIATRTTVFSKLTDDERTHVLPKLRETYEYLRRVH